MGVVVFQASGMLSFLTVVKVVRNVREFEILVVVPIINQFIIFIIIEIIVI